MAHSTSNKCPLLMQAKCIHTSKNVYTFVILMQYKSCSHLIPDVAPSQRSSYHIDHRLWEKTSPRHVRRSQARVAPLPTDIISMLEIYGRVQIDLYRVEDVCSAI